MFYPELANLLMPNQIVIYTQSISPKQKSRSVRYTLRDLMLIQDGSKNCAQKPIFIIHFRFRCLFRTSLKRILLFEYPQFFSNFDESRDTFIQLFAIMASRKLNPNARLLFWHNGIIEAGNINALVEHSCCIHL